jgi:hypothetical protein
VALGRSLMGEGRPLNTYGSLTKGKPVCHVRASVRTSTSPIQHRGLGMPLPICPLGKRAAGGQERRQADDGANPCVYFDPVSMTSMMSIAEGGTPFPVAATTMTFTVTRRPNRLIASNSSVTDVAPAVRHARTGS